nr:NAD(P)/FAD-dependent oxidoreductase [Microbulbifer sediminum]
MKVLIIGAGPTGLTAAIELARQGVIPEIVEKREEASALSRAVGIMPASLEKLRPSGVAADIENEAMTLTRVQVHRSERVLLNVDFRSLPHQPVPHMWGLPQNRTEALMEAALNRYGVSVRYGCAVKNVETDTGQATVCFDDGEVRAYDWVIGADGRHSVVRETLGINYPGIDLDGEWSIADVDVAGYDANLTSLWIQDRIDHRGSFYMILPIEPERVRIVSSTPDVLGTLPAPLDIRHVRRTGTFRISVRQAEVYKKGRVLLAGDAAHCHSPVGGRGMNLGIDDAAAAAKAIVSGTTESYSASRHELGKKILRETERARKMIMSTNVITRGLTRLAMFTVQRSQQLQKAASRRLASL